MEKHLVRIALGVALVLVFVGHAAKYYSIPLVERLELIAYDARLRITMPGGVDERVVIVDIDEKSLAKEGGWPWRRDKLGFLLDQLFDHYKAGIVGFDVVFAEQDVSPGLGILRELADTELQGNAQFQQVLKQITPKLEFDQLFAEKLKKRMVVLGYYFSTVAGADGKSRVSGALPRPVLGPGTFTGRKIPFMHYIGYGANLGEFGAAATIAGHFNPRTDRDGIIRRVPMLAEFDGAFYESLSMAVIRLGLGSPPVNPGFPQDTVWTRDYPGLEWLEVGPIKIPVDNEVTALVPYRGKGRNFEYVSASDVLDGSAPADGLKDKIVLVGTTAPGLFDLRATPVASVYPGVEIHANLIAGMLDGKIKQRPPYVLGAEVVLLLLSGLAMAIILPLLTPLRATLLTMLLLAAVFVTNVWVWQAGNLVLPLASGLLMIAVLFALNMSIGFFVETRAKRQITSRFGQYVPPGLVDEMARHPEAFSMDGESREMSVLFADVRGFTTISEGFEPRELSKLMNDFLTPLTRVIHRRRGTIDKYMGDCIMAFWGAPVADPDHACNAVLAGLEMHKVLKGLAPTFKARGWPEIRVGVGVNSGRMIVGNMGSEIRVAYTVMGDAVNLASRLESLTKRYGVGMIVAERTRVALKDMTFRELDRVQVKGKEETVTIYEPISQQAEVTAEILDELKLWNHALRLYRARDWDMAELHIINLQKAHPSRTLYSLYIERIAHYRKNPPEDGWGGAFRFETK